eukprot:493431_1
MQGDMQQTVINSAISGVCCIVSVTVFIRYIREMYNTKKDNANPTVEVSPVVSRCSTIALFGYTLFTFISFVLDLISLFWFIDFIPIHYTKMLCQVQTFNIAFFMLGKLAMYFFFMLLVHVSFKGSTFAYSPKLLASVAIVFFLIMCTIGGFYTVFLYHDFQAVNSITSPTDCLHFKASNFTTYAIWTGSTCDAIWSFTCLLLFYLRLRAIVKVMERQKAVSRRDVLKITKQSALQMSSETDPETVTPTTPISPYSSNIPLEKVVSNSVIVDQPDLSARQHSARRPSMMDSFQSGVNTIRLSMAKSKKKTPSQVQKFLPVMLKLTILCTWCALSTASLGFSLWTVYPTLSSVIDSTINGICVYLSFGFARNMYRVLCVPFISCKQCIDCMAVVKEVHQLEKANVYNRNELSVLG